MSELCLVTVMSYAKQDRTCDGCGQARLIYSADIHPERVVRDRCKNCLLQMAEEGGKELFVKSTWPKLRQVWEKDERLKATPEQARRLAVARTKRTTAAVLDRTSGHSGEPVTLGRERG